MWAAGCVVAEMVLRRPWFSGTSEMEVLGKIFQVGPHHVVLLAKHSRPSTGAGHTNRGDMARSDRAAKLYCVLCSGAL